MSEIALLCCAYLLGLLCSSSWWASTLLVGLELGFAGWRSQQWRLPLPIHVPQPGRYGPTARWWLVAALVSLMAALYIQVTLPHPGSRDVSRLLDASHVSMPVHITGTLEARPALTRRGSVQIWLNAQQASLEGGLSQPVTGKLYATLPRKVAQDLHSGQSVTLTGQLYRPLGSTRPHSFDFAAFLAREGAFAGLKGTQIQVHTQGPSWGGEAIRERIVRSLIQGTDTPTGSLLGALVLGKNAADVPFSLKDNFIQVGLAHALAASGFQVSLILAAVLTLGRSLPISRQVLIGLVALLSYGLLSGAEPSIVRAILMGGASLAALGLKRQTRPVSLLLAIATLMLLFNPLWVWDLGFQLSMLATLGLIVTVPSLMKALDWLPPTLGSMLAVPLAAMLWTIPLQLYTFGVLPLYSLIANVLTALLLSFLTIGGFISSCGALLWPALGSALAGLLFWPTQLLIAIVSGISALPGHSLALGTLSLWQLLALYGCIIVLWLWQTQWRLAIALGLLILVVPIWQVQTQRFLVTVFDQTHTPMMVIEHPHSTVVINSGDRTFARQSLLPFLQQEGINRIDWAISTDSSSPSKSGWLALLEQISITNLSRCIPQVIDRAQPRPKQQTTFNSQERMTLGALSMVLWRAQPTILELNLDAHRWLLVDGSNEADFTAWLTTTQLPPIQTLWWTGGSVSDRLLMQLKPQVLILSGKQISVDAIASFKTIVPQVFWTERDGTLQWTPQGISITVNPGENTLSPL